MSAKVVYKEDLVLCNCARCGRALLGETMARALVEGKIRMACAYPAAVEGRVNSRPFCKPCLIVQKGGAVMVDVPEIEVPSGRRVVRKATTESLFLDDQVKVMEEGRE